jgi:hypothetical protein
MTRRTAWLTLTLIAVAGLFVAKQVRVHGTGGLREHREGNYRIRTDLSEAELGPVMAAIQRTEAHCRTVFGKTQPPSKPIVIYYTRENTVLARHYRRVTGRALTSFDGVCFTRPATVFGSDEVGLGTLTHELTHILLWRDWPRGMPGWLDESLAVAIGCPRVSLGSEVPDLYLQAARVSIERGRWTPVERLRELTGPEYEELDTIGIPLPGGLATRVGPLTTGRVLIRWLDATGDLPAFYAAFRRTGSLETALQAIRLTFPEADRQLREWVRGAPTS